MPAPPAENASARHALLHDLIDYAGLFPPAGLPLEKAFPLFEQHRARPEAWMLARFVIPAARLSDLAALGSTQPAIPHRLAVLGTGGVTGAAFLRATADDLEAARRFEDKYADLATLDAFEVPLPTSVQTKGGAADLLAVLADAFRQARYEKASIFLEIPFSPDGLAVRPHALAAMRAHNDAGGGPRMGLKLRTGGVTADLFPSPDALAEALVEARRAGVPFKATAGLHHPVRQYRDEVEAPMHGFLNVFGGAVLLHTHDLDAETLTRLLEDEDASAFTLTDEAFAYRDLRATAAQVQAARDAFATSFGSCSFDEPVEELGL